MISIIKNMKHKNTYSRKLEIDTDFISGSRGTNEA